MRSISDARTFFAERQTLVERYGALGRIRLNRPKALNSLTLDDGARHRSRLDDFESDPAVAAVLVTGEASAAFAPAAISAPSTMTDGPAGLPQTFWREEYRLNARIGRLSEPYIAFMDGIVMGGGVGISVYGSHRIVTERTRLAMPETGIGFFPDFGASWFLTRRGTNSVPMSRSPASRWVRPMPSWLALQILLSLPIACRHSRRHWRVLRPGHRRGGIRADPRRFRKRPPLARSSTSAGNRPPVRLRYGGGNP